MCIWSCRNACQEDEALEKKPGRGVRDVEDFETLSTPVIRRRAFVSRSRFFAMAAPSCVHPLSGKVVTNPIMIGGDMHTALDSWW